MFSASIGVTVAVSLIDTVWPGFASRGVEDAANNNFAGILYAVATLSFTTKEPSSSSTTDAGFLFALSALTAIKIDATTPAISTIMSENATIHLMVSERLC